jgi:putative SOS response-associated peptidase YedK
MCGRYDNLIAREAYRLMFRAERFPESNFPPRYNIAPTDQIPIIRVESRDGRRELVVARWGLVPWWSKEIPKVPHINARAETVHKLRMFKEAFARRRALIPATGFFEWQKRADGKQPYRFQREDLEPFAFAGLWEFARIAGQDILSATIIVGEPNSLAAAIHDRMPVILEPADYDRWLDADTSVEELRALLKPYTAERMRAVTKAASKKSAKSRSRSETLSERIGVPGVRPATFKLVEKAVQSYDLFRSGKKIGTARAEEAGGFLRAIRDTARGIGNNSTDAL